jgi:NADH-quinone oxidoreductase subunit N
MQAALQRDLLAFSPELVLCGTIVLLLLLRLFSGLDRLHLGYVALALSATALALSVLQWTHNPAVDPRQGDRPLNLFTGLLAFDNFTIFLKMLLTGFAVLVIWLTLLTRIPDREDSGDFHVLLLGATLGMILMASANHLLMVFIGVEMASLPSYAMSGFLKGRRQSSEAALKYVVYGGGSAGVMLYGISLLAGKFGTGYLPQIAEGLAAVPLDALLVLGLLFIFVGFCFKLAAVPFHFWCPDVFEGAPAEVAGFLSVASKAAAVALVSRFSLTLAGLAGPEVLADAWGKAVPILVPAVAVLAAVTATFGNLAALGQTNLKRLLAYSTIAHAGYMLMGLATFTPEGVASVLFYLVVYLFMNLGAFAIVAFLRNLTGSEDLADCRGLVTRAPVLVISLAVCLLSLLGMPPLGGFVAKFQIFQALYNAGNFYQGQENLRGLGSLMYTLLFVLGINSVISLVYYVKVLRVMILEPALEEVEGRPPARLPVRPLTAVYASLMGIVLLVLGLAWPLDLSNRGSEPFRKPPAAGGQAAQFVSREAQ